MCSLLRSRKNITTFSIIFLLLIVFLFTNNVMAKPPFNNRSDNSVIQVKKYLEKKLVNPKSIKYLLWSPVRLLKIGKYKVTVQYNFANRYSRVIRAKKIFILSPDGVVLKVLSCR